ncbi:hypothetical protein V2J09_015185 [Rumex salicifolius]
MLDGNCGFGFTPHGISRKLERMSDNISWVGQQARTTKRRRNEYIQNPLPKSHSPVSAMESALKTISDCIEELRGMSIWFPHSSEHVRREKILEIKFRVLSWLDGLFHETREGYVSHLPASAMVEGSRSYIPITETVLSIIKECIQGLTMMQHGIKEIISSLYKGESVEEKQHEVLHIKSTVLLQLGMLFKPTEDEECSDEVMHEFSDSDIYYGEDEDEDEDFWLRVPEPLNMKELRWSSANEMEGTTENERYLCLSNGYEIWCLDLQNSWSCPPKLPKIAALSLLGSQLPASVGLFKLGSRAYMIGGQGLPASLKNPSITSYEADWDSCPEGLNLYKTLLSSDGLKRPSYVTYRLSLAADEDEDNSITLSLSHTKASYIKELIKPKFWPIVEKIGGNLHVIDSDPAYLENNRDGIFTHEVCNLSSDGGCSEWNEIPTILGPDHIISHIVVGERIYALTDDRSMDWVEERRAHTDVREGYRFLEFDSREEKWKGYSVHGYSGPFEAKRMRDIVSLGISRCALLFRDPFVREPLYVLISIRPERDQVVAVGYLVTSTGEVVCYQQLHGFFSGAGDLQPYRVEVGTMIHVDDEEVGTTQTLCSVFTSPIPRLSDNGDEYLFINTFTVEMLQNNDAVYSAVAHSQKKRSGDDEIGPAVEVEFLRFVPKNWYIFDTDSARVICHIRKFVGWRACFLTPS